MSERDVQGSVFTSFLDDTTSTPMTVTNRIQPKVRSLLPWPGEVDREVPVSQKHLSFRSAGDSTVP